MGFYMLQDGAHEKFYIVRSRFFWQKKLGKQGYHMVKWTTIFSPKETMGLGVINTKVKWAWKKLLLGHEELWTKIFGNKYVSDSRADN